jgi:hypothetical protein
VEWRHLSQSPFSLRLLRVSGRSDVGTTAGINFYSRHDEGAFEQKA